MFLVDFQTRANPFYLETRKRVKAGDIGTLVLVDAHYHGGRLGNKGPMAGPEGRLKRDRGVTVAVGSRKNDNRCFHVLSHVCNMFDIDH